jgi:hypothetical protein
MDSQTVWGLRIVVNMEKQLHRLTHIDAAYVMVCSKRQRQYRCQSSSNQLHDYLKNNQEKDRQPIIWVSEIEIITKLID